MKTKPFDLTAAMNGAKLVTRDGREAKFIAYVPEARPAYRVVVLLGREIRAYREDGKFHWISEDNLDLFLAVPTRSISDQAESYAQAVRDDLKRARPTYFSDGYQAGWNSALEQAMKVIESISVPAGNSAAGELAFLWTMDNMREARDAIRALKREQS